MGIVLVAETQWSQRGEGWRINMSLGRSIEIYDKCYYDESITSDRVSSVLIRLEPEAQQSPMDAVINQKIIERQAETRNKSGLQAQVQS